MGVGQGQPLLLTSLRYYKWYTYMKGRTMRNIPRITTALVSFIALGIIVSAGVFLATYNPEKKADTLATEQQPAKISTISSTGLLGVSDTKNNILSIEAKLVPGKKITSTDAEYTIALTLTNATESIIQFSPSIDLFVRDSDGKTHQVSTGNDDPLAQGPLKPNEVRTGTVSVRLEEGKVPKDLYYQPNNAKESYRIAL